MPDLKPTKAWAVVNNGDTIPSNVFDSQLSVFWWKRSADRAFGEAVRRVVVVDAEEWEAARAYISQLESDIAERIGDTVDRVDYSKPENLPF